MVAWLKQYREDYLAETGIRTIPGSWAPSQKGQRLLVALLLRFPLLVTSYEEVSDCQCDCYFTNESFPESLTDPDDESQASPTSHYFLSNDWNNNWATQNWKNSAPVQSGNASVVMSLHYLSVRMYARTVELLGAVTAMFTYKDDGDPNPANKIQYTNQHSYTSSGQDIPASTRNATTPASLNWTDQNVVPISFQVPRDPSSVVFKAWSDRGVEMSVGSIAYLQIQWIEMGFNTTEPTTRSKRMDQTSVPTLRNRESNLCDRIRSIDDTTKIGTPVPI
ncbi:glycoside hydrolase family 16 protein [Xylariaceae sp. AK1471]|nr:glycoside hydrolase family 16 protein [Xylariaceae sp. AK1471]